MPTEKIFPVASPENIERAEDASTAKPRLYFIDNLRTFLTLIVILHHTIYTIVAGWDPLPPYPGIDISTIAVYLAFAGANQAYFMSLFFFLAGLFVQKSLDRKGLGMFLLDRAIRLLVPNLFIELLIFPLANHMCVAAGRVPGIPASTPGGEIWSLFLSRYKIIHTWFIYLLFVFSALFALLYRIPTIRHNLTLPASVQVLTIRRLFAILFAYSGILFIVTFCFRIPFPIGIWVPIIGQLAYLPPYILFFSAGIASQHRQTINLLPRNAKNWIGTSVLVSFVLFIGFRLSMALIGLYEFTMGGPSWLAAIDCALEMTFGVFMTMFLIVIFRQYVNSPPSELWKRINGASYTVYLIQQIVILPATLIVYYIPAHPLVLWIISSVISVPCVFSLAMAIKTIPKIDYML
ncbi:acyltransferase 3 [Cladochytrium replicatum]|nr:acyltransferase 3 [Cladochytrium replicatum]